MDLGNLGATINNGLTSAGKVISTGWDHLTHPEDSFARLTGGNGEYRNTAGFGDFWNGLADIFTLGGASRIQNQNELYNLNKQAAAEKQASAEQYQREKDFYDYTLQKQLEAEGSYYQRRVEDIKKAGLNPWLAVQSGLSGSSSAEGSSSNVSKTNVVSGKQTAADGTKAVASMLAASAGMMMSAAKIASSAAG